MYSFRFLASRFSVLKPINSMNRIRSNVTRQQKPLSQATTAAGSFLNNNNTTNALKFNAEPENYSYYAGMRIYSNYSWFDLANIIIMTSCCTNDFFVSNCLRMYELSRKILGAKITEFLVANTMGRIFISGDSIESMENFIKRWRNPSNILEKAFISKNLVDDINILMSYSNEAPAELFNEKMMDENTKHYAESLDLCAKANQTNNAAAFKCSSICYLHILKKGNQAQLNLRSLFSPGFGNLSQSFTAKEVLDHFTRLKIDFTFSDFQEFMSVFLHKQITESNLDQVKVTKFEWLKDMHMFYVDNPQKTRNKILIQITKLNNEDLVELEKFCQRLRFIFDRAASRKQRVLVDAEQTYMQATIDSFATQFSNIHNKETAIILNTFQNYLKSTKERLEFELERCKSLNIPFGAKMVRGAYMIEERRLAQEGGYEDPIQPTIEDTHNNYNNSLEFLIANWIPGSQVIIASHNEHSVKWGKYLVKKYDINPSKGFLSFAQLLGLGDQLTYSLAKEGYTVGKMCHFGPIPYMVPYLIRRAQESRQVLASSSLKKKLAFDEIKARLGFK